MEGEAVKEFVHQAGVRNQQAVNRWPRQRPRRLVVTDQSSPTRRHSAQILRDLRGGQPRGHRSFWGQVKPEPLCSLLGEVSSWGPSAIWATKSPPSPPPD